MSFKIEKEYGELNYVWKQKPDKSDANFIGHTKNIKIIYY